MPVTACFLLCGSIVVVVVFVDVWRVSFVRFVWGVLTMNRGNAAAFAVSDDCLHKLLLVS
jgi:uncharacterized membrane protein